MAPRRERRAILPAAALAGWLLAVGLVSRRGCAAFLQPPAAASPATAPPRAADVVAAAAAAAVSPRALAAAAPAPAAGGGLAGTAALALAGAALAMVANGRGGRRRGRVAVAAEYVSMCRHSEPEDSTRRRFEQVIAAAQEEICTAIEAVDGKGKFSRDGYTRANGNGGGLARVMADGNVFEKAGIALSVVYGEMPEAALTAASERGTDRVGTKLKPGEKVPFFACGLSSVMHPKNPHCPTMHFNYRFFETGVGSWWFGGGTDITPSYLDEEDMRHFHGTYKQVCDKYDKSWYLRFKKEADDYFLIAHRGETRGLGGIFFDDFAEASQEKHTAFAKDCLEAVPRAYVPILEKHKNDSFTEQQKEWQLLRRGRYAEFNLVYDRGTVFGMKMLPSGVGRVETILMSLPENAKWKYMHEPSPGSPEAEIMELFRHPRDWV